MCAFRDVSDFKRAIIHGREYYMYDIIETPGRRNEKSNFHHSAEKSDFHLHKPTRTRQR